MNSFKNDRKLRFGVNCLRVNGLDTPIGIDSLPMFSWIPFSSERCQRQSAYRIVVSSSLEKAESDAGDMWDSGFVKSSAFYSIKYEGKTLSSHTSYYWRVHSQSGEYSAKSRICKFTTGIFSPDAWAGEWIGLGSDLKNRAAVYLCKAFSLNKEIKEAIASVSGLGYFELKINGKAPDDSVLNCCNTQYNKTVLYRTFDVTSLLSLGENTVGVELGNGFYNEQGGVWNWENAKWRDNPKCLFQMTVRYEDGTSEAFVSDCSWRASNNGPITFNSVYYGEDYDARRESYDWSRAEKMSAPKGNLVCQTEEPIRRTEALSPQSIKRLPNGSYIICSPEMLAGWAKFTFRNTKCGSEITITYGEKLENDGSVQRLGGDGVNSDWWRERNIMTDIYISKGEDIEIYEPKFSYKGFRYIQVSGYNDMLSADDIVLYRIANDVRTTGYFDCSNSLINELHSAMVRTVKNNLQGKPTDTPVWEKNGWLGDANLALEAFLYNFDFSSMLPNFVSIMEDCFEEYGLVPQMVPTADWGVREHYVWNSVFVFAVYELYKVYGMKSYLEKQYPVMKRYAESVIEKLRKRMFHNKWICPSKQLGDWVSPMGTDPDEQYNEQPNEGSGIVGTAYVYGMLTVMVEITKLTGHTEDGQKFKDAAKSIYHAFNRKFYNKRKNCYETSVWKKYGKNRTRFRQTSQLVSLYFGLVPEAYKESVVKALADDIEAKNDHLDTGCVGTRAILPVLTEYGCLETAYKILTNTTYPSWGYMISQGSDTLWEMWENTARSHNHYFLGTYDGWLYRCLAGITDVSNGYETFSVKPCFPEKLTYVRCTQNTVRGDVKVSWKKDADKRTTLSVTVPFGAEATVYLPCNNGSEILLNGEKLKLSSCAVIKPTGDKQSYAAKLGSGEYAFIWKNT